MNKKQITHPELVAALVKPGEDIIASLTPEKADLLHMGVGVSGEAGELLDAIKRHTIYNKELDVTNVIEELGDMEFFMERIRQVVGITREQTLQANIDKLSVRYEKLTYSDAAAQERADKKQNPYELAAIAAITQERWEQVDKHGFTVERDRAVYQNGELILVARCLFEDNTALWPADWSYVWLDKFKSKDRKGQLIVAGAMLKAHHEAFHETHPLLKADPGLYHDILTELSAIIEKEQPLNAKIPLNDTIHEGGSIVRVSDTNAGSGAYPGDNGPTMGGTY